MHWAIPIFIITCNRLTVLQESIASYEKNIRTPHEIVIHDNHSTFPPMVAYLKELETQGVHVYWHDRDVTDATQLDAVRMTVDDWFKTHDAPYYVVTDPDVAIDDGPGDILEFYASLLDRMPEVEVVGPMLHVDDLPDHYPLKATVRARRAAWFAGEQPLRGLWQGVPVSYYRAPVDTTFGLYRRHFGFRRLASGLRVLAPYDAQHLDWYINPAQMTEDQVYYLEHASDVSHWGGSWLKPYVSGKQATLWPRYTVDKGRLHLASGASSERKRAA